MFFLIVMCFIKSFLVTSVFFPKWCHFFNLYLQYWMSRSFFRTLYIHLYHFSYATCRGLIVWFMVECFSEFFFHELLKFHCYNTIYCSKKDNMRLIWCSTVCSVVLATRKKFVDESYYRKHVMSFLVVKCGIKFIHICICI